jgi:aquaporin Z
MGSTLVLNVYSPWGRRSGAHLNPAVTLGFLAARRTTARLAMQYLLAQFIGALIASGTLRLLFPTHANLGATIPRGSDAQSFVLEVILTAMLMFVILSVAIGSKERGLMAGIAIGGVIGLEAMFAGPISGASMNPFRSLAPAILSGHLAHVWLYLIAPVLGALIAVPLWHGVYNHDGKNDE